MSAEKLEHPPKDQLIAFGQGRLIAEESSQVEQHLEVCRECCETLLDLKDDTFVGLVKIAQPSDDDRRMAALGRPGVAQSVRSEGEQAQTAEGGNPTNRCESSPTVLVQSGEAVDADELPAELRDHPRYRIVELIGRGGMGNVYRAEHRLMNRPVAIKVINSQLVRHPQAVERFRREVQAAAKLSHPNIVAAHDAEQAGDAHFLVMEFVEGTDLASVVKQRGPMSVAEACECIRQAAAGLQHAHEKGMVHRDIKPHNLMLATGGQVRILDFGLAGFAETTVGWVEERDPPDTLANKSEGGSRSLTHPTAAHLTTMGSVMGTPDYMAPEQATDAHSADIRADIYSLGCTLHFLLTGKPPFEADNVLMKLKAHAEQEPPSLMTLRKDMPVELSKIAARMIAKNPAERFQAPAEVATALAPFAKPAASPPKRRVRTLVAAALLGLVGLLVGVIYVEIDKGQFIVEVADDQVAVALKRDELKIRDAAADREYLLKVGRQRIRSGEYEIIVTEPASGLEFSPSKNFSLKRGDVTRVSVRFKPKPGAVADAPEQGRKPMSNAMSETVSVGINGSFEATKSGLPVSWSFYTPKTVPTGDFDIVMDRTDFKEGEQSLKFVVRKCDSTGGRLSPGFFNEFHVENHNPPGPFETKPGETYKISFWAKNAGSEFVFKARGVSALGGEPGAVIRSKETINEWRRFECTYTIPPKMWLRLELNVVQPGTFWIDDLQIVRVNDKVADQRDGGGASGSNRPYSARFLKEYDQVVRLGRDQLTDDERKTFFAEFPDREVDWSGELSRGAMEIFANLPDSLHDELRKTGYLKWRFADMTAAQQKVFERGFYLFVRKPGWKPELIKTSEVGFAIVPLATSTVVSAFVLYPNDSSEMWSTVVGVREAANDHRAAHLSRLPTLRAKPLTKSPPQPGQAKNPGSGVAGVPTGVNLITDPSLEDSPKNQLPPGWSPWFTDGPKSEWKIANLGHTGQRSLNLMALGTRAVVFANSVPLDRSKRYALKGWVLFNSSDKDARAIIKFNYFHAGKWLGVHDLVGVTGEGRKWRQLEKTDAADEFPEATLLVPTCHIEGQGTAWFDDLELIAYDRDKLPANFEAVHGKNNRLLAPLDFDRWVGEWDATFEVKPNAQSPQDRNTRGTMTTRKVLDDRFLLTHSANEGDPTQWLWLLTHDANFAAYRIWIFGSGGEAFERRGQWDAASQMLTLQQVPPSPGVTGQSTDRFIGNDRIESTLFVKSAEGQVTRDNRWSAKKQTPQPEKLPEIPIIATHAPLPEELSLLNKFAGEWTIRAKSKPSIWLPNGGEETLTEKVAWILGGRFLMARTFNEKDELTSIWLATYEPKEQSNRFWFFNADGSSGQWRVTWDASSRGFHWRSIDMPPGWIGTGFNRWIDNDTFDNQALIKDENGRVLLDGTQDKRRKK